MFILYSKIGLPVMKISDPDSAHKNPERPEKPGTGQKRGSDGLDYSLATSDNKLHMCINSGRKVGLKPPLSSRAP